MSRTVQLIDTIGGKEIYAAHANSADKDGAGNDIATQMAGKIDGIASANYSAPQKITVVTAMPAAANIDPNTIYLVKEAT